MEKKIFSILITAIISLTILSTISVIGKNIKNPSENLNSNDYLPDLIVTYKIEDSGPPSYKDFLKITIQNKGKATIPEGEYIPFKVEYKLFYIVEDWIEFPMYCLKEPLKPEDKVYCGSFSVVRLFPRSVILDVDPTDFNTDEAWMLKGGELPSDFNNFVNPQYGHIKEENENNNHGSRSLAKTITFQGFSHILIQLFKQFAS